MLLLRKIILIISAIVVLILGMWFAIIWHRFIYKPLQPKQTLTIRVPLGTGIYYLAKNLQEAGLIDDPRLFIFWAKISNNSHLLKAGEYQITPTMTAPDLLANIVSGKVMQRSILFVEGWTFQQIKQTLNNNPHIENSISALSDHEIMSKLGHPDQHPEGLFFPDTYFFTWGNTDLSILKQAYDRMQKILKEEWEQRDSVLPYKNKYQALIVASLIEKETAVPDERAKIADVILQRLEKRMLLQVDPTVLYGLGIPYGSDITKDDLLSNTPYNTYQHYGLPPTPIDMPSRASIHAALHPEHGDALYYVSTGNGRHIFSSTYAEHRKAVEQYQRKLLKEHDVE